MEKKYHGGGGASRINDEPHHHLHQQPSDQWGLKQDFALEMWAVAASRQGARSLPLPCPNSY